MKSKSALIFGNNEYGIEIAKNIVGRYKDVTLFSLDESEVNRENDYNIEPFDLSDDWEKIEKEFDLENSIFFCVLSDPANNIFLTISLRSAFLHTQIISLSTNMEDANKLKMAGATKVIPIVETTANIITDMLKKPIISKVLHSILYEESLLKIVEIEVHNADYFGGKYPADIKWSHNHGVLLLSIIHKNKAPEFVYSSKSKHNLIENGDMIVVIGYEADLDNFKRLIGEKQ